MDFTSARRLGPGRPGGAEPAPSRARASGRGRSRREGGRRSEAGERRPGGAGGPGGGARRSPETRARAAASAALGPRPPALPPLGARPRGLTHIPSIPEDRGGRGPSGAAGRPAPLRRRRGDPPCAAGRPGTRPAATEPGPGGHPGGDARPALRSGFGVASGSPQPGPRRALTLP